MDIRHRITREPSAVDRGSIAPERPEREFGPSAGEGISSFVFLQMIPRGKPTGRVWPLAYRGSKSDIFEAPHVILIEGLGRIFYLGLTNVLKLSHLKSVQRLSQCSLD